MPSPPRTTPFPAMQTRLTALLGIQHPIVLPGMTYISVPDLVVAVCEAGGLGILASGALSSGEIASRFHLTAPAVSQHLKTLRGAKLVSVRAEKQKRIYALNPEGVREVSDWVEKLRAFWNPRLDALEEALASDGETAGHGKTSDDK